LVGKLLAKKRVETIVFQVSDGCSFTKEFGN